MEDVSSNSSPFVKIRANLNEYKEKIAAEFELSDDVFFKSDEEVLSCLDIFEQATISLTQFFKQFPYFEVLFQKEFMNFEEFISSDNICETIFFESFCLPQSSFLSFDSGKEKTQEELKLWQQEKLSNHELAQEYLKEQLTLDTDFSSIVCKCSKCFADYRSLLRNELLNIVTSNIELTRDQMLDLLDDNKVTDLSRLFKGMVKQFEKKLSSIRTRFKKASFQKMKSEIHDFIESEFHYPSSLSLSYLNVLKPLFIKEMEKLGLSSDLVTDKEHERFLESLGTKLYREHHLLLKDFQKFIKSIMFIKRKDISGEILSSYLGEFWAHSIARKKKRKIYYHMGPTNSGKTYRAIEALCEAKTGTYLAPLRLLAAELYDTMNKKGTATSLLTGEEVVDVEGATHFSSTIEMAKLGHEFNCCVIDEIQMISDPQRGWAWTRALVGINADSVHLCGDHSVLELVQRIVELCGDELELVSYQRMTELKLQHRPVSLRQLERSDALIVFSRRNALRYKHELEKLNFKVSVIYGRLSPEVRREQARRFDVGETDLIVSTDAISMGMNLPIRRIVFSTLRKFINSQELLISDSEIKQISGRAGRYGRFPIGYVTCLEDSKEEDLETIEIALNRDLVQSRKCMLGPDLDIFTQVNSALTEHGLQALRFSEFLNIFNAMIFEKPFYCVSLKEMIEVTEMVEDLDQEGVLTQEEVFGFSCAPVNLGLLEHVHYFMNVVTKYVTNQVIQNPIIDYHSSDIDYLETSIKCVELYQWLARHFQGKNFIFNEENLLKNKMKAVEKLNELLSEKVIPKSIKRFDRGRSRRDQRGKERENQRENQKGNKARRFSKSRRKASKKTSRKTISKNKIASQSKASKLRGNTKKFKRP